jgi:AraC-like DNA-binding protein
VVEDDALAARLIQCHTALETAEPSPEQECEIVSALAAVVACYVAGAPPEVHQAVAVQRARAYLDGHVREHVPLDVLAHEAGVRPWYLVRLFRRTFGLPPHAYQAQARVRLAKRLLAEGVPPARAAAEAGFCDQSHLTRHFKRHLGVAPGRYAAGVAHPHPRP